MSRRGSTVRRICVAVGALGGMLLVGAGLVAPRPVAAQVTSDAAAARIRADYNVKVLRVRPGEVAGAPVWLVTVMKPGGDSNDAFQVTTLAVDQATGKLVPAFRHGPQGPVGTAESVRTQVDKRPSVMRSGAWR
ncbi:MAG: hypothetical protein ACE5GS_02090 [Kiloniellaceae bacterium]